MQVERLSEEALEKILSGKTEDATSVIKFYSNECDLCHALSDYYKDIADSYDDIHFFAFNVDDSPGVAERIGINGVPSISLIKTRDNRRNKLKILSDPENPHKKTWYTSRDITDFINKER